MSDPSLIHHTFVIERRYPASIDRVFAAWTDPQSKRRWFTGERGEHTLDFRVGGVELSRTRSDDGKLLAFESRYLDIVGGRRIVYVSTLSADDHLATSSITSVELRWEGSGTVLVLTESGVFLDGQEQPSWREQGTSDWLDALGRELTAAVTS